jgi:hypothetical protein
VAGKYVTLGALGSGLRRVVCQIACAWLGARKVPFWGESVLEKERISADSTSLGKPISLFNRRSRGDLARNLPLLKARPLLPPALNRGEAAKENLASRRASQKCLRNEGFGVWLPCMRHSTHTGVRGCQALLKHATGPLTRPQTGQSPPPARVSP